MTDRQAKLLCIPVAFIVFGIWFQCGVLWERKHSAYITPVVFQHRLKPGDTTKQYYRYAWPGDTVIIYNCTNP